MLAGLHGGGDDAVAYVQQACGLHATFALTGVGLISAVRHHWACCDWHTVCTQHLCQHVCSMHTARVLAMYAVYMHRQIHV